MHEVQQKLTCSKLLHGTTAEINFNNRLSHYGRTTMPAEILATIACTTVYEKSHFKKVCSICWQSNLAGYHIWPRYYAHKHFNQVSHRSDKEDSGWNQLTQICAQNGH